ncbi:MAG TPA: hypothetical protein VEC37_05555 [Bacillota bacterium]|nr:hypothetical protein [Bacillota bacterium]
MSGFKWLRRMGEAVDRHYLKQVNAFAIPGSRLGLLLLCYHPYQGKQPLLLDDQTTITQGAIIGEFHLGNTRITEIAKESSPRPLEWRLMQMLKGELAVLAEACIKGEIAGEVQAFYGVNVLVAGARRLGFTLVPLPKGWKRWWVGFWESLLRLIYYSYQTKKKAVLQKTMDPYEVWITRDELVRRYTKATIGTSGDRVEIS